MRFPLKAIKSWFTSGIQSWKWWPLVCALYGAVIYQWNLGSYCQLPLLIRQWDSHVNHLSFPENPLSECLFGEFLRDITQAKTDNAQQKKACICYRKCSLTTNKISEAWINSNFLSILLVNNSSNFIMDAMYSHKLTFKWMINLSSCCVTWYPVREPCSSHL